MDRLKRLKNYIRSYKDKDKLNKCALKIQTVIFGKIKRKRYAKELRQKL